MIRGVTTFRHGSKQHLEYRPREVGNPKIALKGEKMQDTMLTGKKNQKKKLPNFGVDR